MEVEVRSPFPFAALPRIWRWIEPFRSRVSDDFAPRTLEQFMAFAAERWERQKTWAIHANGELGGFIAFEQLSPWLGTAHWIFKPDFQGKGIAARASRIAVAEMFAVGIGKLAVYPLAGNLAMGSLLTSLGAAREGKLIAQTLCDGKPADMWVYGLTKQQFEEKQHAVGSSSTSNFRSGLIDPGVDLRRQAENDHQHDDIAVVAGDERAAGPALIV